MRRRAFGVALGLPILLVASCGSSDKSSSSRSTRTSESAARILKDASAALSHVSGYHFDAVDTVKGGRGTWIGDVAADGNFAATFAQSGGRSTDVRLVGGRAYLRFNRAFWLSEFGGDKAKVALVADQWFIAPPKNPGGSLPGLVNELGPRELGYCLDHRHGTLRKNATAIVDGRRVIVIVDKGDKPGTAPGEYAVALTGPPLLIRATQTGAARPGGDERCNPPDSSPVPRDVALSRFNQIATITAPAGAVDLTSP